MKNNIRKEKLKDNHVRWKKMKQIKFNETKKIKNKYIRRKENKKNKYIKKKNYKKNKFNRNDMYNSYNESGRDYLDDFDYRGTISGKKYLKNRLSYSMISFNLA